MVKIKQVGIGRMASGTIDGITAYAADHPSEICIASLKGYKELFLSGPWPKTITLHAVKGKSTIVITVK